MSAKKEKIRICNRPMRSSSPQRYSKYNQSGRKMDSKFISSALVIYEHPHSRATDKDIAYNAQDIRHIAEDEKSERRGEEHLRVVIDRNLLRRRADIRPSYSYLTDAGESSREDEINKLHSAHMLVARYHKRQAHRARKRREPEDYPLTVLFS